MEGVNDGSLLTKQYEPIHIDQTLQKDKTVPGSGLGTPLGSQPNEINKTTQTTRIEPTPEPEYEVDEEFLKESFVLYQMGDITVTGRDMQAFLNKEGSTSPAWAEKEAIIFRWLENQKLMTSSELSTQRGKNASLQLKIEMPEEVKLEVARLEAKCNKALNFIEKDIKNFEDLINPESASVLSQQDIANRFRMVLDAYADLDEKLHISGDTELVAKYHQKVNGFREKLDAFQITAENQVSLEQLAFSCDKTTARNTVGDPDDGVDKERLDLIKTADAELLRTYLESDNRDEEAYVFGFLKLTPREKLMAYAAIETGRVDSINAADIMHSQSKYIPNPDKIMTKLARGKVGRKVRTSTIDIALLAQARRVAGDCTPTIEYGKRIDKMVRQFEQSDDKKNLELLKEYSDKAELVYRDLIALSEATMGYKKRELRERIEKRVGELHKLFGKLKLVDGDDNAEDKLNIDINPEGINLGLTEKGKKTTILGGAAKSILAPVQAFVQNGGLGATVGFVGAGTTALSTLLLIPAAFGYFKGVSMMTKTDRLLKGIDIFVAQSSTAVGGLGASIGGLASCGVLSACGGGLALVGGAVNTTMAMANFAELIHRDEKSTDAAIKFAQARSLTSAEGALATREARYEQGLIKLGDRINQRAHVENVFKLGSGIFSVLGGVASLTGLLFGGSGAAVGAVLASTSFAINLTGKIVTNKLMRKRSFGGVIDEFVGLDKMAEQRFPYLEKEDKKVTDKKREQYRASARKEILGTRGFKSESDFYTNIMHVYAKHIHSKIFGPNPATGKELEGYLAFCRSVSIRYNPEKEFPTENMIFNKLMA